MGEFFLVIMMCIAGECTSLHDENSYKSYDDCYNKSVIVAKEMNEAYPQSSGQCFCLTPEQYKEYLNSTTEQERQSIDEKGNIIPKGEKT